jgi:NAD(P)H-dependent FMN reductase
MPPHSEREALTDLPLRVALITGSTREGRFGPVIARWFASQAAGRPDIALDDIDLAEVNLPAAYTRRHSPEVGAYIERIALADGYVVVTPEYNHGYPAALKQAIDLPHEEWKAKPLAFVSYGGLSGGLRAVEQLRQVFAELHVVTLRDTVSFHNAHGLFDEAGRPRQPDGCNAAAAVVLDQLAWWARALRAARLADRAAAEAA